MPVPNDANTYLVGTIQIPSSLLITAITKAYPMVVTASVDSEKAANTYVVGQLVRLFIPRPYGMPQANQLTGQILAINGLDFSLDINSTQFDTFAVPVSGVNVGQPASFSPAGSRNLQLDNTTRQVPFQSLNDRGN